MKKGFTKVPLKTKYSELGSFPTLFVVKWEGRLRTSSRDGTYFKIEYAFCLLCPLIIIMRILSKRNGCRRTTGVFNVLYSVSRQVNCEFLLW